MSGEEQAEIDDSKQIQVVNNTFPPVKVFVTTGMFINPCWQGKEGKTIGAPLVYATGDEWLSATDLASRFQMDYDKLRKRLERWRKKNPDQVMEVRNRRPGEPKLLFRLGDVAHLITALKDERNVHRQASGKK
jgi:hypothetical protein